jgi:NADH dehydrogenase
MLPHVVIVGGGFGGLAAARALARAPVRVTLLDRANHHLFQPLLYQVATAGLAAPAIAAPIRHILRGHRNVTPLMAEVRGIDVAARAVALADGTRVAYDHLVVASGATHSYFGHDEWAEHAPGLKTLDDALAIRRQVLIAFERAEREPDPERRRACLTSVVIGGGPTGVELAGTLAEIARHTLSGEFRHIDSRTARVLLVEGSDRVLPTYPADLSEKARAQLERLGVEVRTGVRVTKIESGRVWAGEKSLEAGTILWAAGVAASPLGRDLAAGAGVALDRAGRVPVAPDLSLAGHPEIAVVGDLATLVVDGEAVPGVAPAAKQMGRLAGENIVRRLRGEATRPFRYVDYGALATIGRNSAVAVVRGVKLWGYPAWLFWVFVHILFLIGFRNRLVVMIDWAWAYWTFQRYARIVTGPSRDDGAPIAVVPGAVVTPAVAPPAVAQPPGMPRPDGS